MKTKIFSSLILILFVISGCMVPVYLPKTKAIDVNQYGSYIKITRIHGSNVRGELLAVDTTSLILFADSSRRKIVRIIPVSEVKRFTIRYAQPKKYWWTMAVFSAVCASHGWWAALSIPLNLIITAAVSVSAENAFTYSQDDITYVQLRMFARFPGGIPSNIILSSNK
jgi:hypothetical protein